MSLSSPLVSWVCGAAAIAAIGLVAACGTTQLGATDIDLAKAKGLSAQGAGVFDAECARCHGHRGEGLAGAPAILGPGALPEYPRDSSFAGSSTFVDPQQIQIEQQTRPAGAPKREPFRTGQDLYKYVIGHLPKARATALRPDDYWGIVTYIASVQGSEVPKGGVTASNADSIAIVHR